MSSVPPISVETPIEGTTDLRQKYDEREQERRKWWRWHFAGQIQAGVIAGQDPRGTKFAVVQAADLLIEELEKETV